MTRADIIAEYDVDTHGTIRSPGKFEGEPVYAPYFYDALMNGFADDDDGVASFNIDANDIKEFPELANVKRLRLWESEQGFVYIELGY